MLKTINKIFLSALLVATFTYSQDVDVMVVDTSFAGYTEDIIVPVMLSIVLSQASR